MVIFNYICSIRHLLIKIIKLLGFSFKGVFGKYLFEFCVRPLDHCVMGILLMAFKKNVVNYKKLRCLIQYKLTLFEIKQK